MIIETFSSSKNLSTHVSETKSSRLHPKSSQLNNHAFKVASHMVAFKVRPTLPFCFGRTTKLKQSQGRKVCSCACLMRRVFKWMNTEGETVFVFPNKKKKKPGASLPRWIRWKVNSATKRVDPATVFDFFFLSNLFLCLFPHLFPIFILQLINVFPD